LPAFAGLDQDDRDAIEAARSARRVYGEGSQLVLPGDRPEEAFTLFSGWACVYQVLDDGRRHIPAVLLPGDLIGLEPASDQPLPYGVEAVTGVSVCVFARDRMHALMAARPGLAWLLAGALATDRRHLMDGLTTLGRRTAAERVGVFCLELFLRAGAVGMVQGDACPFPLTQTQIGDALGLSAVHVSRMTQQLRSRRLLEVAHGRLRILDLPGLKALSRSAGRSAPPRVLF
jgi:CRP-like cAMP-binding protein